MSDEDPSGAANNSAADSSESRRSGRWSRATGEDAADARDASKEAPRPGSSGARTCSSREGGDRRSTGRSDRSDRGKGSARAKREGRPRDGGERSRRRDDAQGRSDRRRSGSQDRGSQRGYGRPDRDGRDRPISETSNPQRAPRSWDRTSPRNEGRDRGPRAIEPDIPEDITGHELDRDVWTQLRTLSKDNADGVAKHLVASASVLEEDPDKALSHALHAAGRAGRVPAVREALGLVYYRRGEFADALREFRTARRLSGSDHLLPYMVDSERGLGRYERALDLAASPAARKLAEADNIELLIVVSGIRRDLGQPDASVAVLNVPALQRASTQPWAARLFYAYADALLAAGRQAEAKKWFAKAAAADATAETDADERLDELDGFVLVDLEDDGDTDDGDADGEAVASELAEESTTRDTVTPRVAEDTASSGQPSYDALTNPFSDD